MRISSHSWGRPALLSVAGAAVLVYFARTRARAWLNDLSRALESPRAAGVLAGAAAAWALLAGVAFGTFAVGGADSYGYVGQARLLAHGQLTDRVPFSRDYTWPDVAGTFTPLGFTPGSSPGVIAPRYPPGLPLLMAPLLRISERAMYLLVPCLGALLVWLTYALGRTAGDAAAGALGAVLLSTSPTFLYQVVQPMSDVPAAACWLAALLIASRATAWSAAWSGLVTSLAVMIRPNLAPLAAIVLAAGLSRTGHTGTNGLKAPLRRVLIFLIAIAPGLLLLGWMQHVRYGSATASGYGRLSDAFALGNIAENLARYPRWVTETHTWFIWLAVAAPLWIVRRARHPFAAWAAYAMTLAVWGSYLPYLYFHQEEWFYTRFLLPAIAVMLIFAAAITRWALEPLSLVPRTAATLLVMTALAVNGVRVSRTNGAFEVRFQERKYPLAGVFVRDHLPSNAIVLSAQHSGSIRYYSGRPTFRWDLLSPPRLDQALSTFRAQGYEPFLVVDGGEYEDFKKRFDEAGQRASRHPALLGTLGDARVYALE